jgi:nicotinate-nucleotide pyrophosphorylase (carboxylating)
MKQDRFENFFDGAARQHLNACIALALREDGVDLTSNAVFRSEDTLAAEIRAKSRAVAAGLPLIPIILQEALPEKESPACRCRLYKQDGDTVQPGDTVVRMYGGARRILKAERVVLNFLCHLSGIASMTAMYVDALRGSGMMLLDTRKTQPGLRYPEKYAVLVGGGCNHRRNLSEMHMLKDNHIDAAGSIQAAVSLLRRQYTPCPPIEVECRTLEEVEEAVVCRVDRIMLDNMDAEQIGRALARIPESFETEISGGINLESIRTLTDSGAKLPTFISAGRLTHSAPAADFSMRITKEHV